VAKLASIAEMSCRGVNGLRIAAVAPFSIAISRKSEPEFVEFRNLKPDIAMIGSMDAKYRSLLMVSSPFIPGRKTSTIATSYPVSWNALIPACAREASIVSHPRRFRIIWIARPTQPSSSMTRTLFQAALSKGWHPFACTSVE